MYIYVLYATENNILMLKYLFLILITPITNYSFSQTGNNKMNTDSIVYTNYFDSIDAVSFNYPKSWNQTKIADQYLLSAEEKLTSENDKFKENLIFGKVEISADLDFLLTSAIKSTQQDNEKIVIIAQEIKTNFNGVQYAIFKYSSSKNSIQYTTVNIYLKKEKYGFYLILSNSTDEEKKYSNIYDEIVESIKFHD